jgi:hypothetical protein
VKTQKSIYIVIEAYSLSNPHKQPYLHTLCQASQIRIIHHYCIIVSKMSFTQPIVFNINATYAIFDPKAMESMASQAREAANSAAIMDKRTPPKMVETPADRKRTFSQCESNSAQTTNPTTDSASVADSVLTQVSTAPPAPTSVPAPATASVPRSVPERTPEPAQQQQQPPEHESVQQSNSPIDEDTSHSVSAHDSIDQQSIATSRPNQYPEIIVIDDDDDDDEPMHVYIKKESDDKRETSPRSETQTKRLRIRKHHDQCKKIMDIDKERKLLDQFKIDDEMSEFTPTIKNAEKNELRYREKCHKKQKTPVWTRSKSKQTFSSRSDYLILPNVKEAGMNDNYGRVEVLPDDSDEHDVSYSLMHQNFDNYSGPY